MLRETVRELSQVCIDSRHQRSAASASCLTLARPLAKLLAWPVRTTSGPLLLWLPIMLFLHVPQLPIMLVLHVPQVPSVLLLPPRELLLLGSLEHGNTSGYIDGNCTT